MYMVGNTNFVLEVSINKYNRPFTSTHFNYLRFYFSLLAQNIFTVVLYNCRLGYPTYEGVNPTQVN